MTVAPSTLRRFSIQPIAAACSRMPWRCLLIAACAIVAYSPPLLVLAREMRYDTPLAYLGLVPALACAIGYARYHRASVTTTASGSQAILGGALILLALAVSLGLPFLLVTRVDSQRLFPALMRAASYHLDLLSLPIFATGMVIVLFGTVALRWAWPALLFCVLVWPPPYDYLLGHLLPWLTNSTAQAVALIGRLPQIGAVTDPRDPTLFTVLTPQGPQALSVGTACSGFSSLVAWLLIGVAIATLARPQWQPSRPSRPIAAIAALGGWLIAGATLVFIGNLARIALLFWLARAFGVDLLYESIHLVIGMTIFAGVVIAMVCALPRFGLGFPAPASIPPGGASGKHERVWVLESATIGLLMLGAAICVLAAVGVLRILLGIAAIGAVVCCFAGYRTLLSRAQHRTNVPVLRHLLTHYGTTISAVGALAMIACLVPLALALKHARAEQIPALGWRIDLTLQDAFATSTRVCMIALLLLAALALARSIAHALAHHGVGRRPSGMCASVALARAALIACAVVGGSLSLGVANATVTSFDNGSSRIPDALGARDFDAAPPDIPGATRAFVQSYDWTKQSLGKSATYRRFRYDGSDDQTIWVDVMTTQDADALAFHSIRNCYNFHGFVTVGSRDLSIGDGANASVVNYVKPDVGELWSALYWEQRVQRDGRVFFQRIVILANLDSAAGEIPTPAQLDPGIAYLQHRATELLEGLTVLPDTHVRSGAMIARDSLINDKGMG